MERDIGCLVSGSLGVNVVLRVRNVGHGNNVIGERAHWSVEGLVVGPIMWGVMEGVGVLDVDGVGDWWMAM